MANQPPPHSEGVDIQIPSLALDGESVFVAIHAVTSNSGGNFSNWVPDEEQIEARKVGARQNAADKVGVGCAPPGAFGPGICTLAGHRMTAAATG